MKTTNSLLTVALGLTAHVALAQLHPPPQPLPDSPAQSSPYSLTPAAPAMPSGSDASGSSVTSGTSGSGASGSGAAGASAPTDSSSAPDTPGSIQDSSGASGMHSEAGAELRTAPPPVARLQPQTQNDVTYLCGGVGADEANYMKQQARGYDLMLTFAARDGEYLADVNVDISDAKGKQVLQANCDGPMMLVDLPRSGSYRVHANAAGYTQDRTVKVRAKEKAGSHLASVVLSWPQQVAEAPAAPATSTGSSGGKGSSGAGGGTR